MRKIGILGLQGAVSEHAVSIKNCGAQAIIVKTPDDLQQVESLILPGGESTAHRHLLDKSGLFGPIQKFAQSGKPVFGTCAGMILMAKEIINTATPHLAIMDICVARNSFGRQIDSFEQNLNIQEVGDNFPGVFIRAPEIKSIGKDVKILCEANGKILMARQKNMLCCSFHPELTPDNRVISYFLNM
jgi:5'-phosphate synthase pdxT subunit